MNEHKTWTDKFGMALPIGCMVHCILLPFVVPFLPFLGFLFDHDSHFHLILSGVIVLVAAVAFIPGYLKHKSLIPLSIAAVGIATIVGVGLFEELFPYRSSSSANVLVVTMVIGSTFIVLGHWANHTLSCKCKHHFPE